MLTAINFHYVRPEFSTPYPGIHGVTPEEFEAVGNAVQPLAETKDRAHELGTKAISAGAAALPVCLHRYLSGNLRPQGQDLSDGNVFRRSDFCADAVRRMWANFDGNMLDRYLANREADDVEWPMRDVGVR